MKKNVKTLLLAVWTICSLSGCGSVPRPKGDICQLDIPRLRKICFDMEKDYNDDGKLKDGVKPHFVVYPDHLTMLEALDKSTNFDPRAWEEVKVYIRSLKEKMEDKVAN